MFEQIKPDSNKKREVVLNELLQHPSIAIWEHIFDSLPDMIALIDNHHNVVKTNKAMKNRLGMQELDITRSYCFELMHDGKCMESDCPHKLVLEDQKVHTSEIFEPKFNSYFKVTTTPLFDDKNALLGSLHIMHDITIEKESEAKLLQYNQKLENLNLNKDKFFSIVAHDLRSPFQGMLGFTDLILDEIDSLSREEIIHYLKLVQESSYSAFSLLENLLCWSRLQTGRLEYNPIEFDINQELNSVLSLLNSNAVKKGIMIINQIVPGTMVKADKIMIHSVLLNLLTNAIKFTEGGKSVIIGANTKELSIEKFDSYDSIEIFVKDQGIGMDSETVHRLLDKDAQFSSPGTNNENGSGIGMVIVREMIEKHGSSLQIVSESMKGSIFSFSLPYIGKA